MPTVERTYLEMRDRGALRPARTDLTGVRVERVERCTPAFYRLLYTEVGRRYRWIDRLGWTDDEIRAHLETPGISVWLLSVQGGPAGYFELSRGAEDDVEIAYFGLFEEFTGQGLGGYLLTEAVARAWAAGARRVWLHTCTLDHPAALPNYLARGFAPYRVETIEQA